MSLYTMQMLSIDSGKYSRFLAAFRNGGFRGMRLGQAFYSHFNVHRLTDQAKMDNLFELDGPAAHEKIRELFDLH